MCVCKDFCVYVEYLMKPYIWQLSFDLIKDWVANNQSESICTSEGVDKFTEIAIYQDYHGLPKFRKVGDYTSIIIS